MTSKFMRGLSTLIADTPAAKGKYSYVRPAFEDTLAVAVAGWGEPVTRNTASAWAGGEGLWLEGGTNVAPETAALIYGTAAHALDYDDVHQFSSTHPSAPIVAALMAAGNAEPGLRDRTETAFAVGLAANVGLGRVLGFSHYEKGWHATSTIGSLAAAAAVAFLFGLDATRAAYALALATAQAGGLQRNFGAMAKPLQAGFAASAGLRAAILARAGVTADPDVFSPKGYFDLYGGEELNEDPDRIEFDLEAGGISVKLFPCCYMTHRLIAAAFQARDAMDGQNIGLDDLAEIDLIGPPSSYLPLRVQDPQAGSEAKFCGAYTVACALIDGEVGLAHFEDDAVHRADVRELMKRVRLLERDGKPDGMERRTSPMDLAARDGQGNEIVSVQVGPFPGSPDSPPTASQMEAKVRDCLAHHGKRGGNTLDYYEFQALVDGYLGMASRPAMAEAGD